MNRVHLLTAMMVLLLASFASAAQVGVSVTIGQPGFYGTIELGGGPPPQLIYPQPIIIQPQPVQVVAAPLYLRVPPGHMHKWAKHCQAYNACGRPVYFVQDSWYNNVYVPAYHARHDHDGDHDGHHDHDDDYDRGHGHDHDGHDDKGHGH